MYLLSTQSCMFSIDAMCRQCTFDTTSVDAQYFKFDESKIKMCVHDRLV